MGAIVLRGGKARREGSEGALDECSKHLNCSGVIPGGLEVQGLGKGPPGVLTCGAAEQGAFSGFDLFTPWTELRVRAMPVWVAQEVGGSKLHLGEARCCVAREGEDNRKLCGGGEGEVIFRYVPDLPLTEELAADLRAKVRVRPGKVV